MSTKPEDLLTKVEKQELLKLYQQLVKTENIKKPDDVESSITPLYNWLEGMFEHPQEPVLY
jgi:hypothetical protein